MKINEQYQIKKASETERFAEAFELTRQTIGNYFDAAWVIGYTFESRAKFVFRVWSSVEAKGIVDEHKPFISQYCQGEKVADIQQELNGLGKSQREDRNSLDWDELFEKVRNTFCALLIVGTAKDNKGEIRGFSVDEVSLDALIIPRMYFEDWIDEQDCTDE